MHLRRFYCDVSEFVPGDLLTLASEESQHIIRSLRMKEGEAVLLFNGQGLEAEGVINLADITHTEVLVLKISSLSGDSTETLIPVSVALPFLKADKMEHVLQMATEMGATHYYIFESERCVSRPRSLALEKKMKRWRRIILESVRVSGRNRLPGITAHHSMADLLNSLLPDSLKLFAWEEEKHQRISEIFSSRHKSPGTSKPDAVCIITGPEGGFSRKDADTARENGVVFCSLGTRILRADTAPIAALGAILSCLGEI